MERKYCPYCMNPIQPGEPCPSCGLTEGAYTPSPHHLPPGTVLAGRYLVGRVLGEGGFGITYIGCDLRLELRVAIKEYYPGDRVNRNSSASLAVSSFAGTAGQGFNASRERFIQEARVMARMDKTPQIVAVRDFFQENNTAYIVMEFVDGTTFKELVGQKGGKMSAAELLPLVEPLFTALSAMHALGLIHRDISPDNLMLENGGVRLLDFGCARESAQGVNTMTIVLKHGYSPIEQYQHKGQGPWTDVYSLAATLYYCLTGKVPPQALDRICDEELIPPRQLGADLSPAQESALLRGMGVRRSQRYRSVEEFHSALYKGVDVPVEEADLSPEQPEPVPVEEADPSPEQPEPVEEAEAVPGNEPSPAAEPESVSPAGAEPEDRAEPTTESRTAPDPLPRTEAAPEAASVAEPEQADGPDLPDEPAPEPKPNPLKGKLGPILGVAAAAVLCAGLLLWAPWKDQDPNASDPPVGSASQPAPPASGSPAASQNPGPAQTQKPAPKSFSQEQSAKENGEAFLNKLADDSVDVIKIPQNVWVDVMEDVTLTKPLRVEGSVSFFGPLTVAEGGRVEVAGNCNSNVLLRTTGGGSVSVQAGGYMSGSIVWLEHEGDLTCDPAGTVDVWGGFDPTKGSTEDAYAMSHCLVLDEEALFANAIHVRTEEEFVAHCQGDTPIVIDGEVILNRYRLASVPILISEGSILHSPCDQLGDCTLDVDRSIVVNRGTVWGRLSMVEYGYNSIYDSCAFLNYGRVMGSLNSYTPNASVLINLGALEGGGELEQTSLCNLGTLTISRDSQLSMSGNWSANSGSITVNGGTLTLYGGTGVNNFHSIALKNGGRLVNYGSLNHYSGSFTAATGSTLENHGTLYADVRLSMADDGSLVDNSGIIECATGCLAGSAVSGDGHVIPFSWNNQWDDRHVRWADTEEQLRLALQNPAISLVIWNGPDNITFSGGDLTITKWVAFSGGPNTGLTLSNGGITVTGEDAFLRCDRTLDLAGNGLRVENGGTAKVDDIRAGSVAVTGGGMLRTNTTDADEIDLSDGGVLIGNPELDGATVRIGEGARLLACHMDLHRCEVVNDGSLELLGGHLNQHSGTFTNNGTALFSPWDRVWLNGKTINRGELRLTCNNELYGTLTNEAGGSVVLEDGATLWIHGTLDNRGDVTAMGSADIRPEDGGRFTGNMAEWK